MESYQGETRTLFLEKGLYDMKRLGESPTPEEHLHNIPLAKLWIEWYEKSQLNDFEMYAAIRYINNPSYPFGTYKALEPFGKPKHVHIVAAIGAEPGVDYLKNNLPEDTNLWIAAIDKSLNNKGYIVPGLGDAGDLAFGAKLQH